jgi:hypothetical protein
LPPCLRRHLRQARRKRCTRFPRHCFALQEALRDREWFWPLYLRLAAAKAEHKGILDNVDMVLMEWIRHPERQDQALEFLNVWIAHQPLDVIRDAALEKLFDATLHHLKEQPVLLNRAVTAWLLHDDMRYPIVAFRVISRLQKPGAKSLALDPTIIDTLQPNEIRFLVRRILGFIVDDDAQIRLIFSLVRTCDAKTRTLGLVAEALRDHVGYDFPYRHEDGGAPARRICASGGRTVGIVQSARSRGRAGLRAWALLHAAQDAPRLGQGRGEERRKAGKGLLAGHTYGQLGAGDPLPLGSAGRPSQERRDCVRAVPPLGLGRATPTRVHAEPKNDRGYTRIIAIYLRTTVEYFNKVQAHLHTQDAFARYHPESALLTERVFEEIGLLATMGLTHYL